MVTTLSSIKNLLIFSAIIALGISLVQSYGYGADYSLFMWACFGFFNLIALLGIGFSALSTTVTPQKSIKLLLGFSALKFLFSLLFLLAYYLIFSPVNKNFIIPFLVLYFLYTLYSSIYGSKIARQKTA